MYRNLKDQIEAVQKDQTQSMQDVGVNETKPKDGGKASGLPNMKKGGR
jgi:hypothetical protein